jgi:Lamin Tail Domain
MRYILLSFLFLFCITNCTVSVSAQSIGLEITEINFAGSTSSTKCKTVDFASDRCGFDKWVELTNTTNSVLDISGYTLLSREGVGGNEQFVFPQNTGIIAGGSIVIRYSERNFSSVLSESGIGADFVSYSMLRISNNETHQIRIKLVDTNQEVIDVVNLDSSGFVPKEYSYSISKVSSGWIETTSEFFALNHGTPRVGGITFIETVAEPLVEPVIIPAFVPIVSNTVTATVAESLLTLPQSQTVQSNQFVTNLVSASMLTKNAQEPVALNNSNELNLPLISQTTQLIQSDVILTQSQPSLLSSVYKQFMPMIPEVNVAYTPSSEKPTILFYNLSLDTVFILSSFVFVRIVLSTTYLKPHSSHSAHIRAR